MINQMEFLELYQKYLDGQCTAEEVAQLEAYQDDDITLPDESWDGNEEDKERIRQLLYARVQQTAGIPDLAKHRNYGFIYKVAASIIIVITAGLGIWHFSKQQQTLNNNVAIKPAKILPGGNKAYLTMANGKVVALNGLANGTVGTQAGVNVNKVKNGLLQYAQTGKPASATNAYDVLTTPRGGQYQVQLADGTHVWLNAATTLKYPALFNGGERRVELSGEAYFEVAKNPSKPFIVSLNGVDIKVLGTHFNAMGYPNEQTIKTTLLEGAVKLSSNGYAALLKPGQQGSLNQSQSGFKVQEVDVDDAVAWKNGFFAFNNEDIQTIMNRVARWYDVDVVFPDELKRRNFGGTVSRFNDVSQVLKSLELTGSVHFKIEGRRIIVMP